MIPFSSLSPRVVATWFLTLTLLLQMTIAPVAAAVRFDAGENGARKNKPAKSSVTKRQINPVPVTSVSAASFEEMVAPDSIVAAFGSSLATATKAATTIPLPTMLEGTTLTIRDSAGVERLAPLFFVSPNQVNYAVPADTALGPATVIVRSGDGKVSEGPLTVKAVAPAIFTANSDGRGVPAANLLRVKANGAQIFESLAELDAVERRFKTKPIDLGPEGERVFLILYLTGLRRAADPNRDGNLNESFRLLIGGVQTAPLFAGPLPSFVGLDQINSAEIPRGLAGRGRVNVAVAAPGFSTSNLCEIEIAPLPGLTPPQVTGFSIPSAQAAQAGQTIAINGSGFSSTPAENLVRIGGVEASVKSANPAQLQVIAPFGAETGRVSVRTPGGEGVSPSALPIRTSISGFVETTSRQPLRGVTVKVAGANISATTDAEGAFILSGVAPGAATIEIDPGAVSPSPRYPRITLAMNAGANRDNQYPVPIALQPETNKGINIGAAGLENAESVSAAAEESGAIQSGNVTFEVPVGARVNFPDGSGSGTLYLTVVEQSRTPVSLPAGHFSSAIAQITPFGAKLDVGGKLTFPNADGLPAGTEAKLFRFDQRPGSPTIGRFVEAGTATVSADGQHIETADGLITEATFYFASAARATTTAIGRVVERNGNPARRALVRSRGQEAFTDGNGGFILRNVPVRSGEQLAVEASLHRPKGRIDRARRENVAVTVSGVTSVAPDIVLPREDDNRPPALIAPTTLSAVAGQTTEVDFAANDLEGRVARVGVSGAGFASVVSRSDGSYSLRLAPGVNDAKSYELTLTAVDDQNLSSSLIISLAVIPPPPAIADFNPKSARVGDAVTITGRSLKAGNGNPVVSFAGAGGRRIPALVNSANTNEVRATVPNGAATGAIELMNDYGGPARSGAFTVRSSQDFAINVAPAAATAPQGGSATYVISVTSPDSNFTQLAKLSVTGAPTGAKASFNPEQITAGATSTLTLRLESIPATSYSFTIGAKANVDGLETERTASASVNVQVAGRTTLSGRVLSTKDEPILGATVSLDGKSATTDASGSFLLSGITAGKDRPVMVNGRTASAPGRTYPVIAEPVDIVDGTANVVPYTFYLPTIDVQFEAEVKPNQDTMVTTPMAPGVMMMVPANAKLRMRDGTPVTRVSLTPVDIDRTPAPLPPELGASMVFTSQPGGAISDIPIPVIYPNKGGANPGTKTPLWYFNHDTVKWERYGTATVSKDGRHIVPDIDPRTGRMYGLPDFSWHPDPIPNPCEGGKCCNKCPCGQGTDPVDFSSGLKIEEMTDISIGGARGGLELTRTWTNNLATNCANCSFGVGTTHNYGIRLSGSFEDGGAGRVIRPGEVTGKLFGFLRKENDGSLLFTATASMVQVGDELRKLSNGSFEYKYRDGNKMRFDSAGRLTALVDRNGNTTTLSYAGNNLMSVRDAVGRSLTFQYEGSRISKVTDPLNREWKYEYDGRGRLAIVTDPLNFTTKYEYDNFFRLTSVTDKRGIVIKRVIYDDAGRVKEQRFADGGFERYSYSFAGPTITGVTIANSLGRTKSMRFNGSGQVVEMVDELGQRSIIERHPTTDLPKSTTGPCGCVEDKREYDARGNAIEITDQLGKTTFYEYEPIFNNLMKMTDRRGNVTTYTYDTRGNRLTMTNARGETTTYTYDQFGQLKTISPMISATRCEWNTTTSATSKNATTD